MPRPKRCQNNTQRGNILFLILLAVVLFAALSYAVVSSTRGGGKSVSAEKLATQAAQILQTATLLENTVARMRVSGECKETEFRFDNPVVAGYANTSGTPADKHCYLFDPAGGGASFPTLPPEALDSAWSAEAHYGIYFFSGAKIVNWLAGPLGGNLPELMIIVPFLKDDVCRLINNKLYGISTDYVSGEDNMTLARLLDAKFTGSFAATAGDIDGYGSPGGGNPYSGFWLSKAQGCTRTTEGASFYYHVLIAR